MNKDKLIKELENATGLDHEKCVMINHILESYWIVGKKNKEKMIFDIAEQLSLTDSQADKIYELAMSIIGTELKDKLRHSFRSQK